MNNKMKRTCLAIAAVVEALVTPGVALSQSSGQTIMEGYVFDVSTLKPLPNAVVSFFAQDPNNPIPQVAAMFTDSNGFYSLVVSIPPGTTNSLKAECVTSNGIGSSQVPLFTGIQRDLFQRNFYLTLPRNKRSCLGPPS